MSGCPSAGGPGCAPAGAGVGADAGGVIATGSAPGSTSAGSSQIARATARYPGGPPWIASVSELAPAGTAAVTVRPRGDARTDRPERSVPDHSSRATPSPSVIATEARTAPRPSRQSWGRSMTRVLKRISWVRRTGKLTGASAAIISARPRTPSGLIDHEPAAEPSSSAERSAPSEIDPCGIGCDDGSRVALDTWGRQRPC